jgi:NitT/TauT family transport system substrate-binding protein
MIGRHWLQALLAAVLALATAPAKAELSEIKITKQPGLLFAPMLLMEQHKLLEKHAKQASIPELKVSWVTIMSGGANNDALLSGSVHITTSGVTNMLLLWGKTNGDVKAITGVSGLPFKLVTRNPNIKTIKDYTPSDRIAVPTVRQSIQAITLGIALQKAYGDDRANEKLLANQVTMGHPDALTALLNPQHEVASHFASSPFQEIALKTPGIHVVLESRDALGGDCHVALAYATTKFYEENPKTTRAFLAAYAEGQHDQERYQGFGSNLFDAGQGARHSRRDATTIDATGRDFSGGTCAHHGLRRVHGKGGVHQADAEKLERLLLCAAA